MIYADAKRRLVELVKSSDDCAESAALSHLLAMERVVRAAIFADALDSEGAVALADDLVGLGDDEQVDTVPGDVENLLAVALRAFIDALAEQRACVAEGGRRRMMPVKVRERCNCEMSVESVAFGTHSDGSRLEAMWSGACWDEGVYPRV